MRLRATLAALVAPLLALPVLAAAGPPAVAAPASGATAAGAAEEAGATPRIVGVRAGQHRGYDRFVVDLSGGLPSSTSQRWAAAVYQPGTGARQRVHGGAILQVTLRGVEGVVRAESFGLRNVNHVGATSSFEAQVDIGIGLMVRQPVLRAFTVRSPDRFVIDVRNDYAGVRAPVWFADIDNYRDGTEPYVRHVLRTVPSPGVATGQLHRLYAGPTLAERQQDLRLITSVRPPRPEEDDDTGFRGLSVRDGVARVTITGDCDSRGWTLTVADLLMPTLKHWPSVHWVKIYDEAGRTAAPTGRSDSVPACLEP